MSGPQGRLVERAALSPAEERAMFALYARHFVGARRDVFRADLDDKGWVVLLEREDELVGFSTLARYDARLGGATVGVVCSGDTIVERSARSSPALAACWIGAVNRLRSGSAPLYWLLLVSGFRTYRFLPRFWARFHPRFDRRSRLEVRALVDALAAERFGERYDREAGIVRFAHPAVLRGDLRGIPPERMRDPHVAYFARRNPGHERGDELVCLTEIAPGNLTRAGRRMWRAGEAALAVGEVP